MTSVYPHPIDINTEIPNVVKNGLVYDYYLNGSQDYIYNIVYHTHPLLISRFLNNEHFRISSTDIDYVQLIVNSNVISTIRNDDRKDPVFNTGTISPEANLKIEFLNGDPIVTGLLNGNIILRIVYWREPVTPFYVTYNRGNSSQLCWGTPSAITNEGYRLTYCSGGFKNIFH